MRQGHNPTIRDAKSHAFIHCKVVDEISHHLHVRYHTVEWALLSVSPWCRHLVTVPTAPRRCTISATSSAATRTSPASWARWASTSRNWTHPTPDGPTRHPYPPAVLPPRPKSGVQTTSKPRPALPGSALVPKWGAETTARQRCALPSCCFRWSGADWATVRAGRPPGRRRRGAVVDLR